MIDYAPLQICNSFLRLNSNMELFNNQKKAISHIKPVFNFLLNVTRLYSWRQTPTDATCNQ